MLIAVISGFAAALAAPWVHRVLGRASGWCLGIVPLGLFAYFVLLARQVMHTGPVHEIWTWIPSLGMNLTCSADGLGLVFALLISGIGFLVTIYSGAYLDGHWALGRWYAYLLMFMASMLGLVLSGNLLGMFVFWELTSFSSYLLIGFHHEREDARHAALQALLVTGLGGLAMLAGLLLLGRAGGSMEFSVLAHRSVVIQEHPLLTPMILLLLAGAFTKSAQFPFHFWLPNAMAAPAPASAYLHSSTMVKAGIYLMARLHPMLGGAPLWDNALVLIGAITFFSGAGMAVQQNALKRLLAYSTVSALGGMTMLLGLGTASAVKAALVFLVAHALYKAALFLTAGTIEHETGERDVQHLGGLGSLMPRTFAAAALAGLSMAGAPLFAGFAAKELFFEAMIHGHGIWMAALTAGTVIASALFVAVALCVAWKPFSGRYVDTPKRPHEPGIAMWSGPTLLGVLGAVAGLWPGCFAQPLAGMAAASVVGAGQTLHLAVFPEWHAALGLSALAWLGGAAAYWSRAYLQRAGRCGAPLACLGPERGYQAGLAGMLYLARVQTRFFQSGYLRVYLMIIVTALLSVTLAALLPYHADVAAAVGRRLAACAQHVRLFEVGLALMMIVGIGGVVHSRTKLAAVAALGVVGYGMALVFVFYGAPDLAMTQFVIETLTVILFVLVFYHLPPMTLLRSPASAIRDLGLSAAVGALMALLTLISVDAPIHSTIAEYFRQHSALEAHGRNIVNVILVDFRGIDTMGEITVLAIAGVGAYSLLKLRLGRRNAR